MASDMKYRNSDQYIFLDTSSLSFQFASHSILCKFQVDYYGEKIDQQNFLNKNCQFKNSTKLNELYRKKNIC